MKTLADILRALPDILEIQGDTGIEFKNVRFDSRQVEPGDCFVAIRGATVDGHQFIDKAVEKGAVAIVCETGFSKKPEKVQALILVADSAAALGHLAAEQAGHPSANMQVIGITGTNGKTTTSTLLHDLFNAINYKTGLIGTVENRIGRERLASTHTTPDAVGLQQLLRQMADAGCTQVFMETSSHAIDQRRIAGVHFAGAVFTNLTHDHLDYHHSFAAYRDAKKRLFDQLPETAFALINVDDKNGQFMVQNCKADIHTYGLKRPAHFKTKIIENGLSGLHLELDGEALHARLIGEFNAYNLTAVYATARLLGAEKLETLTVLSALRGAEGRFEAIAHPTKPECIGIIDYAHTPDALEQVLETILKLKKRHSKVITVVGCGGDRDKTKRPLMARAAALRSDQLILTNDNPRTEEPAAILRDMEAGLEKADLSKTLTIENREQAIKTACRLAGPGDVILIAGKGHEKYQEIKGVKYPFDDKEMLKKYFAE